MKIEKSEKQVWAGSYRGIDFEINNFKRDNNCWTHYIFLHLDRIPEKYDPGSFWLKGAKKRSMIMYDYYDHPIIGKIKFHGGITWYSKENGFDNSPKVIKVGCDYQHAWDEGKLYGLEYVKNEVIETIDSFLEFIPDYKYWCCGNGKLYDLKDGVIIDGRFHSFEYYCKEEWFKEKYMYSINHIRKNFKKLIERY
jgi:hypothetical protein